MVCGTPPMGVLLKGLAFARKFSYTLVTMTRASCCPMPYRWDDDRFKAIVYAELEKQQISDREALAAAGGRRPLSHSWLDKIREGRSLSGVLSLIEVLGLPRNKVLTECLIEEPSEHPLAPREQRRKRRARKKRP